MRMFLLKSCLKAKLIKNSSFHFREDFEGQDERVPREKGMIVEEEENDIAQPDCPSSPGIKDRNQGS